MNDEDALSFARQHAGAVYEVVPMGYGTPFRVVVVGAYFNNVLVDPLDLSQVPDGLRGAMEDRDNYLGVLYTHDIVGPTVMSVPLSVLRRPIEGGNRYPHICTKCGAPAYIGVVPAAFDCSRGCRF